MEKNATNRLLTAANENLDPMQAGVLASPPALDLEVDVESRNPNVWCRTLDTGH